MPRIWNEEIGDLNPEINIDTFENNPESIIVDILHEI